MPSVPNEFLRPARLGFRALRRALEPVPGVRKKPPRDTRRVFYDTFDWRLYRRGHVLEAVESADGARLEWRKLCGETLRHLPAPPPRFARDLPAGPFREALEALAEVRALVPVAWVRSRSEEVDLLDEGDKVVCRLFLEEHSVGAPDEAESRPLPPRLRVEGVKGYEGALARVVEKLRDGLGLEPAAGDVLEAALAASGLQPSERSAKVRVDLAPDMPAAEATRTILLRLLDAIEENEQGTRDDVDSEFLHDFRVAVRRTRSALGQIKGVLPPAVLARFRAELAWLGAITTPTRDLDVHLLDFPGYREALPASMRGDLDPLHAFLEARKRREQQALARALGSRRYRRLIREWRSYLEAPWETCPEAPAGSQPVRQVADSRLRKLFRRALREGLAIDDRSPPEALHELRKTCKKLRYLMEFFQSLYPPTELRPFVDALKGLQDNLGEFQDLHVQSGALQAFSREMEAEGRVGAQTHLAMGMLVEKLLSRQEQVRGEFEERFRTFCEPARRERFEALVATPRKEEEAAP